MNRADLALALNEANELSGTMMRNRAMMSADKYRQAELVNRNMLEQIAAKRFDANQAHWNKMEAGQTEHNKLMEQHAADAADKQYDHAKALETQQAVAQKQQLLQSVIALNATGALSDSALDGVNDWLANDEHFGHTGIQISAPKPGMGKSAQRDSAVVNAVKQAQNYAEMAGQSEDPEEAKQFKGYADMLTKWVGKQGTAAAQAPVETTYERNRAGQLVKSTRTPIVPPGAGGPGAAAAPAGNLPVAPWDPKQRVKGNRYRSPNDPNTTATWTGTGWQPDAATSTTAPPQQLVPGMGNAKPPGQQDEED